MKKLEQRLNELYTKGWYCPEATMEKAVKMGVDHTLTCVKEWLQEHQYQKGDYETIMLRSHKNAVIQELIEELGEK